MSGVEDELSEISFIDQVMKVLSEGATVKCEAAHPILEGTVVSRSRFLQILWERSAQAPDPKLVFDGVDDVVDRYPEWNAVRLYCTSLAGFDRVPG